jgi:hypothetical protein
LALDYSLGQTLMKRYLMNPIKNFKKAANFSMTIDLFELVYDS